jgi:hypothetical protein
LLPRGGVDQTQIYPSEFKFKLDDENEKGTGGPMQEHLRVAHIGLNYQGKPSTLARVYAGCCNTPLYNQGSMSLVVNTNLIPEADRPPVRFHIMGRMALPLSPPPAQEAEQEQDPLQEESMRLITQQHHRIPNSVPFGFPFVMMAVVLLAQRLERLLFRGSCRILPKLK